MVQAYKQFHLWCRRTSSSIYAHSKRMTLPSSILLQLVHAKQHHAHLSNSQSDPNRTINMECMIINQLTRLSEAWLSLRRFSRNSKITRYISWTYITKNFYPNRMKNVQNHRDTSIMTLTLRRLMSYIYIYIYGAPILDVSRSHTTTHHSR